MSARLVILVRWIALMVLALAVVLIIARWRLPMREHRSRGTLDVLRDAWLRLRERRENARERAEDLHAILGKTALLVGPEDKSTRVMRWKMEGLRCGVLRARAGTQAVALFRERAPDLVLVDALLPDMSAADFYNLLAESRKPIVFLGVSRHQWDELHKLGRNVVCVGRPFDPEEAAAASGDIIRREQTDAGASI